MKSRTMLLLLSLLVSSSEIVLAQSPSTIEKTEISGISEDMLSAALRGDLARLAGQTYDEKAAIQFAERIQTELPEYVVTPTTNAGTLPNRVGLIFVVAHNINAKYVVESVELKGIDKSKVSEGLRKELQKMVGHPVDDAEADRLRGLLAVELKNRHTKRSVVRGNQPQHVQLVYEAPGQNSVGFSFGGGYHSRQKFSGILAFSYTFFDITGVNVAAINSAVDLTERYAGLKYEYWVGYKRVHFSVYYSSFKSKWSPGTLLAASNAISAGSDPGLYRLRDTLESSAKFTIMPELHMTVGVASTQLQLQSPALHFESVRTATGNVDYGVYATSSESHLISGSYDLHVAGNTLSGSRSYTRHLWDQNYSLKGGRKNTPRASFGWDRVSANVKLGRVTGNAPMFERFSLGSSQTLVGWNKYEIDPLGASRMAYGSITYGGKYGAIFFESGSVWDNSQSKVLRKSVGLNLMLGNLLRAPDPIRFFLNLLSPGIGIPLRGSNLHPMFTIGGGS